MLLTRVIFGTPSSTTTADEALDLVDSYLVLLQKNGQICGEFVRAYSDGVLVAHAYASTVGSTALQHHSQYGIEERNKVTRAFNQEPDWQLADDEAKREVPQTEKASCYCLFASDFDGHSPICRMDTGHRHPLFLLPIDYEHRERLYFWSREYNRMDGIWFASGELELSAYEQMASPSSLLAKNGQELASHVEKALDAPVFYFLMRYYGRSEQERKRKCPGCGQSWAVDNEETGTFDFWKFPFKCYDCRLVSHLSDASDDDTYAHIGEYSEI